MTTEVSPTPAAEPASVWAAERPPLRPLRLLVAWLIAAPSLLFAAWVVPGVRIPDFWSAIGVAAVVAVLQRRAAAADRAAMRCRSRSLADFLLVLVVDALVLYLAADIDALNVDVDSLGWALLAALIASAVTTVLDVVLGVNDDDLYSLRVTSGIARRSGERVETNVPGIIFLEIDGLALPVLQRAMRDGSAPNMARWLEDDGYRLAEWETDLSSQTGASQAGILLGSNEDIPAFRWVEKSTATVMTCSAPQDCAEIERRRATGIGLLSERRREPRQPPLRRSRPRDPDGESDGRREAAPTRATAPSSPTATTSRARSSCSCGRSCSS